MKAYGYVRFSTKVDAKPQIKDAGGEMNTYGSVQREAIEADAKKNKYKLRFIYGEYQTSNRGAGIENFEFNQLGLALGHCEKQKAMFVYVDLGPIHHHPVFFSMLEKARKNGVKIRRIRNLAAKEAAQRKSHFKKQAPKTFRITKKGERDKRQTLSDADKIARNEGRDPMITWKEKNKIPTKRFNNYEHLYRGVEPIYKFFLRPNPKDPRHTNTKSWKPANDYDAGIASTLNKNNYLTLDNKLWTKENVRKTRQLIHFDELEKDGTSKVGFKQFCDEKNRLLGAWEEGYAARDVYDDFS